MILLVVMLLAAQADAAAPVPPSPPISSDDGFRVGVDTLGTVEGKLGKPFTVTRRSDGTTIATYMTNKTRVKGSTFIPIVGLFAGGAKAHVSTKMFIFDQNGGLKSFSSTNTDTDCHTSMSGYHCG
jgi:hypothetical protein